MQRLTSIPRDLQITGTGQQLFQLHTSTYTRIRESAAENSFQRRLQVTWEDMDDGRQLISCQVVQEKMELDSSCTHLEYIIKAISAVTHYVEFYVDGKQQVTGIANMPDIKEIWMDTKARLWADYKGMEIQQLTQGYDNRFGKEKALLDDLLQYNLYGLFLNRINTSYPFSGEKQLEKQYNAIFNHAPLPVTETRRIVEGKSLTDPLRVQISGSLNETQLDTAALGQYLFETLEIPASEEAELLLEQYQGDYLLHHSSYIPLKADLKYRLTIGNAYVRKAAFRIDLLES
ncbi:hypothetical protein [Chitinophaga qingshengii]|uniref:Uncharacterized protein n=1 Tax=Chitinophaga qingshengii TaxID=1569794 RepID=A0ABR7TF53_9BACT|nr:hypothetical protein [Chitinophaga qingshengii]MBC9928941.1 hypothetical protein [Chitinophaga qingshengii]